MLAARGIMLRISVDMENDDGKNQGQRNVMKRRTFVAGVTATGLALVRGAAGLAQENAGTATPATQGEEPMSQAGDTATGATPSAKTLEMTITRRFEAPLARVWQAWSESNLVKRWWGPKGFTAPVAEIDFREGGRSLVCMRSPEGQDLCNTWTYRKIVPMESIEFIQRFADGDGNEIAPGDIGLPPQIPRDVPHVITFKAVADDTTELTVTEYGYTVDWIVEVSRAGMNECLDKMATMFAEA